MTNTKILLDTNILVDILSNRQPNIESTLQLFPAAENIEFCFTPVSIVDAAYIAKVENQQQYQSLLQPFTILEVNQSTTEFAFRLGLKDFEDAIQAATAIAADCSHLISWNISDYKKLKDNYKTPIVQTPRQFLNHR